MRRLLYLHILCRVALHLQAPWCLKHNRINPDYQDILQKKEKKRNTEQSSHSSPLSEYLQSFLMENKGIPLQQLSLKMFSFLGLHSGEEERSPASLDKVLGMWDMCEHGRQSHRGQRTWPKTLVASRACRHRQTGKAKPRTFGGGDCMLVFTDKRQSGLNG